MLQAAVVCALGAQMFASNPVLAETLKLVVLGDSLSAGYQLDAGDSFPSQLSRALLERGHDITVVNAGVSGDTTSGGLSRLDWSVEADADAVIVELGANDMLRGIPPETTQANLEAIVTRLQERGIKVLLAGMMAQRNLGDDFAAKFDPIFKDIAEKHDTLFYPFFLEGVALNPDLNLSDGMHPNAQGVSVIVGNMLPTVETLLSQAGSS